MINRCCQKSSLDAYNIIPVAVETGDNLTFTTDYINTGISITHVDGSATVNIVRPGLYRVILTAVGAGTTAAGDLTIQLNRNGIAVPGAAATVTSAATTSPVELVVHSLISVGETCPNAGSSAIALTFANTGIPATYSNIKLTIVKEA